MQAPFTRKASAPFTIHLQRDDYSLSYEALNTAIDRKTFANKHWHWPAIKVLSFHKGKLHLQSSDGKLEFNQVIVLEKDRLQVSCNCAANVKTVCVHAYRVLERAARLSISDFFTQFCPGGVVELAMKYKKHFTIRFNSIDPEINHKLKLGKLYGIDGRDRQPSVNSILKLPGIISENQDPAMVMTYLIIHFNNRQHLPYIVPCSAKLNKAGTQVKWFGHFLSGLQSSDTIELTDEQKLLNHHCYQICKEADKLSGIMFAAADEETVVPGQYSNYYSLLQKIIPLLSIQPYVFSYRLYWPKQIKLKPSKQLARKITVQPAPAGISFRLLQKKDCWQLAIAKENQKKVLATESLIKSFFILNGSSLQLVASLRDAWLVEWMRQSKNCITVFKEHWNDFQNNILKDLKKQYRVHLVKKL